MPESQNIEYKTNWRDKYLKWICGFANANGGTLYAGVGLSFQVQFIKSDFRAELEVRQELGQERNEKTMFTLILEELLLKPASRKEIMAAFGMKTASGYLNRTLKRLHALDLIGQTIPENPNHPHQKFQISVKGESFLKLVND